MRTVRAARGRSPGKKYNTMFMRFLSLLVILTISWIVFGSTSVILRAALGDEYANWNVAKRVWRDYEAVRLAQNRAHSVKEEAFPGDAVAPVAKAMGGAGTTSEESIEAPSTPLSYSIVEFLESRRVESSFSSRARIAAEEGIQGYVGTAAQNIALLELLWAKINTERHQAGSG